MMRIRGIRKSWFFMIEIFFLVRAKDFRKMNARCLDLLSVVLRATHD